MCELLERARKNQGGITYYRIARMLNTSDQRVRNWKDNKSNPNGLETLKLADMAGLDIKEAIKIVEGGFASLSMLVIVAALSMLCFFGITKLSPAQAIASSDLQSNVYYVK